MLVLVLLCAYAYHTIPGIGTRNSIYANLVLASFLGLVALGQTLVILMSGIDFSVAGFVLLGATVTCELGGGAHWPLPAVVAVVAGLGAVGGAVSGAVSYLWKVQPLIVTLAVGTVVTGFMLVWLGGVQPPQRPRPWRA